MHISHRPEVEYPKSPAGPRIAAALAAVIVSTSLIGGVLGLFDRQSNDAVVARASMPAPATVVVDGSDRANGVKQVPVPKRG